MTSSICPFNDSIIVWAELTDSGWVWLLLLPEAQQPLWKTAITVDITAVFTLLSTEP